VAIEPGQRHVINGSVVIFAKNESGITPRVYEIGKDIELDPTRFDPIAFLSIAEKLARELMSDAVLIQFDVPNVFPNGTANLKLGDAASSTFQFRSPSRSKRPADAPAGLAVEILCKVYVQVSAGHVDVYPVKNDKCDQVERPRPRCSLVKLWEKARAAGAPKVENAIAEINYLWDGWTFSFGEATAPDHFYSSIPDDC
jgi:hypothetical protein